MNAKKCKYLRRVAREQAPKRNLPSPEGQPQPTEDAPYREYQIAPKQRYISLSPTSVRGLYQKYKKLYRKYQQMPVLAAEVAAINAAAGVA